MKRAGVQSSGEAKKTRSCEEPGLSGNMENKPNNAGSQKRLESEQIVETDNRSVISSVMSVKPSESGYGSASIHSGQEQSKSGSGSGSGSGSSKSKSLESDSASASTNNGSEDGKKNAFGKDSLKRRSFFKSCKPPSPDVAVVAEDVKPAEVPSAPSQSQRNQSAKEARALQAVALTRALDCIQKISHESEDVESDGKRGVRDLLNPKAAKKVAKEVKLGLKEKGRDWRALLGPDIVTDMSQSFAFLETEPGVKRKESFFVAISLETGCVVYVTSSMTDKLAFHSDMWTGRNLLDFLHPKDRLVFTNFVTSGLMGTPGSMTILDPASGDPSKLSLCIRFRVFKSLKSSGFAVTEKKTSYLPFKLNLKLHKQPKEGGDGEEDDLFIMVHAMPIKSAYSHSDQNFATGRFSLRHNAASHFNEVDPASIPLLGHMPQDLMGISALDFYHPSDLPAVRDTYCAVLQRHGKSVRSIPFHFRAQNGCYVLLETDWSCFINPWSKKLEFVVGNHRVVKGPSNPDVFASSSDQESDDVPQLTDEAVKIVNEIRNMLGGVGGPSSPKRRDQDAALVSDQFSHRRRRRELAILMGTLLDEVTRAQTVGSSRSNSPRSPLCDLSVVIGDISPHRGASPESSDTPVSYSQLNYNENIERYFQSQPKLLPSESSEEKQFSKLTSSSDESKGSNATGPAADDRKHKEKSNESTVNNEGNSGQATDSRSQLLSSERTSATGSGGTREAGRSMASGSEQEVYHGPELTTDVLRRHNAAMEHNFMEQMKASRVRNVGRGRKERNDKADAHGVKRGIGSSWEDGSGGYQSQQKHAHREVQPLMSSFAPMGAFVPVAPWTPFSLSTQNTTQAGPVFTMHSEGAFAGCTTTTAGVSMPNVVPAYYMSGPQQNSNGQSVMQPVFLQPQGTNLTMPYLSGMVAYQPFYIPQSYVMPSIPFVSPAVEEQMCRESLPEGSRGPHAGGANRCASQATSVKVEPGSQAPSNASFIARKEAGTAGTEGECPASESRSLVEEPLSLQSQAGIDSWQNAFSFDVDACQIEAEDRCQRIYDSELSDGSSNGVWSDFARQAPPPVRRTPPWMQSVESTPDLVYRYQLPDAPSLAEVLERDRAALRQLHQPTIVNDQLVALYREFEADDRSRLNLEEGENTTSSSMSSEEPTVSQKRKTRRRDDFRRSMIYEENASLPAPDST